jgi:hypothetical protein
MSQREGGGIEMMLPQNFYDVGWQDGTVARGSVSEPTCPQSFPQR